MARQTKFDWQEMQSLSVGSRRILALTDVGALIILACADFYNERWRWEYGQDEVSDSQWDEIDSAIGRMENEIMSGLVGSILPHVLASLSGLEMLPCDGSVYLREDYPLLYEAIDPVYIIDLESFRVPDLRERFPIGEGGDLALDDDGGEAEHVLTVEEMPAHAHGFTQYPFGLDIESVGVPDPSGVGNPRLPESTDDTGGNEAHNNMPPYRVVRWAIVAG